MLAEIWRLRNFTFLDGKMIEDVEAAVKYQAKRTVRIAQLLKTSS